MYVERHLQQHRVRYFIGYAQINAGRLLYGAYERTGDERYRKAIELLRGQMRAHPRNHANGFWHKQIYPYQMWLDGIYMAGPFLAEYALRFNEPALFDDVAHQIMLIEEHARDPKTGLLCHAWDEGKTQRWCNPLTGCSNYFWGRAVGWFVMGIVDVLDHLPQDHVKHPELIAILERAAAAIVKVQDEATGLWYQILDLPDRKGNYLEASASTMFVYAFAKAVRNGYLTQDYLLTARRGYHGLLQNLIKVDSQGLLAREMGITVPKDLNFRAKLWKWGKPAGEVMTELVGMCDVALGNEEDAEKVFGIKAPEADVTAGKVEADHYRFVCEELNKKFPSLKTISITLRGSLSASHNTWSGVL